VQELAGGTPTANLLTGLGVDEFFTRTDSTGGRTYLTDALGSSVALTGGSGAVQTEYTYEPFGGTTTSGASTGGAFAFTGREADGTGLYYYRARYYHAGTQRFTAEDPLGAAGGDVNVYAYVANDPTNFTDPSGAIAPWAAACLAGAAGDSGWYLLMHGRKSTWAGAGGAAGRGCGAGLLGFGAGRAFAAAAGRRARAAAAAAGSRASGRSKAVDDAVRAIKTFLGMVREQFGIVRMTSLPFPKTEREEFGSTSIILILMRALMATSRCSQTDAGESRVPFTPMMFLRGEQTMRILDEEADRALNRVTIYLTRDEARELRDSVDSLLQRGRDDHEHVSALDQSKELTVCLYNPANVAAFSERSRRLILEDH
jgi:RHS repeat-associated protein